MTDEMSLGFDANDSGKDLQDAASQPAKLNLRRLEKFQRFFQYGAVLVLLVFIGLIIYSAWKLHGIKKEINVSAVQLSSQQNLISANAAILALQRDSIGALKNTSNALQQATDSVISTHPELAAEIRSTVESNIERHADGGRQVLPRVYMQIASNAQRSRAAQIAVQLRAKGFVVPGIENMEGKTAPLAVSDLRYYGTEANAQPDLSLIDQVFSGASLPALKRTPISTSAKVRPRQYEIWLGEDFWGANINGDLNRSTELRPGKGRRLNRYP